MTSNDPRETVSPNASPTFNPAYRVARCGDSSVHGPHIVEHGPDQPRNCLGTGSDTARRTRLGDVDMRDVRSDVRDFGAVGDGVADDTTALQHAFDRVQLLRDPEPRHQPGHADLPFDEQARLQAKWLNARGSDVCPVCLGFRKEGVCPGGHDHD